jgi:hypothetical protein
VCHLDFVAVEFEQHRERLGGIAIVVDHQHTPLCRSLSGRR